MSSQKRSRTKAPIVPKRGRGGPKSSATATSYVKLRHLTTASPRPDTKTANILALLQRPQGAGMKELINMTNWQPHSIRGFLSGTVAKKMGLKVRSIKTESGERRYEVKP